MPALDQEAPVSGRVTLLMGALVAGTFVYATFWMWQVALQASRFANASNAITFPLQATPATAVPSGIAPDAFGYFTSATLTSSAVTWWPQAWLSIGGIVEGLVHLSVAVLVAILARRAMRGRLLHGGLSPILLAAGIIVAVGGTVARALSAWGLSTARAEVIAATPGTALVGPALPLGDWLPILIGLAVVAVALAIRAGERAQRDTAGLV